MPHAPKIFIVDDEPELLDLIQNELNGRGFNCETFGRAEDLVARQPWKEEGCLITDLAMPGMSGMQLIHLCQKHDPVFSVVVYSATADVVSAVDAMRSGVYYVFEKARALEELVPIVQEAVLVSRGRVAARMSREQTREAMATLTQREREVLEKIATGLPNKIVASELGISINTVEVHRGRVMRKMGAESVAELARALAALGL